MKLIECVMNNFCKKYDASLWGRMKKGEKTGSVVFAAFTILILMIATFFMISAANSNACLVSNIGLVLWGLLSAKPIVIWYDKLDRRGTLPEYRDREIACFNSVMEEFNLFSYNQKLSFAASVKKESEDIKKSLLTMESKIAIWATGITLGGTIMSILINFLPSHNFRSFLIEIILLIFIIGGIAFVIERIDSKKELSLYRCERAYDLVQSVLLLEERKFAETQNTLLN